MKLKRYPELLAFLSTYFPDADAEEDEKTTRSFLAAAPAERQHQVLQQAQALLADSGFPMEEFGTEANRWFGDEEEAKTWFGKIIATLKEAGSASQTVVVKDSNGTVLSEGDSVLVIKDLKVKGGSSDLKRGSLVKKIHLIGDPENIEARVDGSTLVLKTCFLKKA